MQSALTDLRQHPLMVLLVLAAILGVMTPRVMATLLPVVMLMAIARMLAFPGPQMTVVQPQAWLSGRDAKGQRAYALFAIFAAWALISAFWSSAPGHSIGKSIYLGMLLVGLLGLSAWQACEPPENLDRAGIGLLLAVCINGVIMAIDVKTNQGLVRWFLTTFPMLRGESTKHIVVYDGIVAAQSEAEINRRTAVMTLLLWPAALVAVNFWTTRLRAAASSPWRTAFIPLAVTAFAAAGAAIAMGGHQSSQTALAAGIVMFLAARLSQRLAIMGAAAVWAVLVVLIVPIVMGAHAKGLQEAPWLFHSARHRVVIWNHTVQRIGLKPWIGIGADATPAAKVFADEQTVKDAGFPVSTGRHAHNAYLQIWYELGGIGAVLFLFAGLALLPVIAGLPSQTVPWVLAQAATSAIMAASSFSIWQVWFMASIGAGAAALIVAVAMTKSVSAAPLTRN